MDVDAGLVAKKAQVFLEARVILAAFDQVANFVIEAFGCRLRIAVRRREILRLFRGADPASDPEPFRNGKNGRADSVQGRTPESLC